MDKDDAAARVKALVDGRVFCEQFTPIGFAGYGFCQAHERHVSMPGYDDPKLKCLCHYCQLGYDGKHVIDPDVFFYMHDLVGLKSTEKETFEKMVAQAALMKCAPRVQGVASQDALKAIKPAPKPKKPASRLF